MIIGYVRTSTNMQSLGADSQKRAIKRYVESCNLGSVSFYSDEGVSGAKENREALNQILRLCEEGEVQTIICYSFSRISRSTKHLLSLMEYFENKGIDFVSITEKVDTRTPMGRCFFTIIASINSLERELISERVKNGLKGAKERGKTLGAPRKRNGKLIRSLREKGYTIAEIAKVAEVSVSSVTRELREASKNEC